MNTPVAGRGRRYPSDTSRAEWRLIQPLLPIPACRTPRGGRPEAHDRRAVVDAIRYITDNGAKWRALPTDFLTPTRAPDVHHREVSFTR